MTISRLWMPALAALLMVLGPGLALAQEPDAVATPPGPPEVSQPAYDVLRIDDAGLGRAYRVWEEWVPQVVTTPDGGAWAFFTAQVRTEEGFANRHLYASRFDPESKVWQPARVLGSGAAAYGATAATDSQGVVHLIYSDRATDSSDSWSQLVYRRFSQGGGEGPGSSGP